MVVPEESPRADVKELGPLDRMLSVVTEVRAGEAGTALLLAINVSLLLAAYYVVKPVREALILSTGGAELKSYASLGQAALLTVLIPIYGSLVNRVRRQVLIPAVTLFFMGCLLLFYFAALTQVPLLGVAFYLFVGIFNLMVIAQFWSFANDLYTQEQGERLFPVVAFGGSIGAVIGSGMTSSLIATVGIEQMLLVGAGILGLTLLITKIVERRESLEVGGVTKVLAEDFGSRSGVAEGESPGGNSNPFLLVFRSPYLLLIAALMLLANVVNTTGEFILGSVVEKSAKEAFAAGQTGGLSVAEVIGSFYGDFYFWVNVVGVTVQLVIVSRVIRWVGIRGALLVLPLVALGSYLAIALLPILAVVRWVKTAENATDYSLNNTVRNALFLPLTREEKYKAKQAIDAFFVRGGDVASAAVVALGINAFVWTAVDFAWFNVVVVAAWVVVAVAIGRRYANFDA